MPYGEPDEIVGYETLFREWGYWHATRENFPPALQCLNEAIGKTPEDKRALLGRSVTRAKETDYKGAMEDIQKALKLYPRDPLVHGQYAMNMYLNTSFEQALVHNYRMVKKRKKPDNFNMGVMHCSEAIKNCLGDRAGHPLRDHYKIVRKLAWRRLKESEKPYIPKSKHKKKKKAEGNKKHTVREPITPLKRSVKRAKRNDSKSKNNSSTSLEIRDSLYTHLSEQDAIPRIKGNFPYKPLQNYTSNIENYMSEKYLDKMFLDKQFLKELKYSLGAKCPNQEGSAKILDLAKQGYKSLCHKQELLRTRRPFYFIKYQEAKSSGALLERQVAELRKLQLMASKEAEIILTEMNKSLVGKEIRLIIELAETLRMFCDSKEKKVLPKKEVYLQEMYEIVCQAHLDMKRLNKTQYEWDQNKRLLFMLGLPLSRQPSSDSVINQFKDICVDWKKQAQVAEERLLHAQTSQEMAWLYHDLARYNAEMKQYELASAYARKATAEGYLCNNIGWVLNGKMYIIRINIQQRNRNEAKVEASSAIEIAKHIGNVELMEFFQKCLSLIDTVEFADGMGLKILEKREKDIIEMMTPEMKDEVAFLFKQMSAMPATRRMSVMPGVILEDAKPKPPSARQMTIMSKPKDIDEPPQEKLPKAILEQKKGIAFMELIQYHV